MSHFTGIVIGDDLDGQLAKYDENKETPEYIVATKEQAIANMRAETIDYRDNGLYARYIADPEAYAAQRFVNPGHLDYVSKEFPKILEQLDDDDFMYAQAIKFLDESEIDADGNLLSTYNPDSQWDWWTVGGRWDRMLITTDGRRVNECKAYELDIDMTWPEDYTVRVLVQNGEWKQKGKMGWWGISHGDMDDEAWNKIVKETLRKVAEDEPMTKLTLVDFHI